MPTSVFFLGSLGCCCESTCLDLCGTCGIPARDMKLNWTTGVGSVDLTLYYRGAKVWSTDCYASTYEFRLQCTGFQPDFLIISPCGSGTHCSSVAGPPNNLVQTSLRCGSDFQMVLTAVLGVNCPGIIFQTPTFTITDPQHGDGGGECCVTIEVKDPAVVGGALVTVKSGATTIASGTTSTSTGKVTLNIGSADTYTVGFTAAGHTTYSADHDLACGDTLTIPPPAPPIAGGAPRSVDDILSDAKVEGIPESIPQRRGCCNG